MLSYFVLPCSLVRLASSAFDAAAESTTLHSPSDSFSQRQQSHIHLDSKSIQEREGRKQRRSQKSISSYFDQLSRDISHTSHRQGRHSTRSHDNYDANSPQIPVDDVRNSLEGKRERSPLRKRDSEEDEDNVRPRRRRGAIDRGRSGAGARLFQVAAQDTRKQLSKSMSPLLLSVGNYRKVSKENALLA